MANNLQMLIAVMEVPNMHEGPAAKTHRTTNTYYKQTYVGKFESPKTVA